MMEFAERGTHEKGLQTLWIIWVAMVGSLLVYLFLCHQFVEDIRQTASHDLPLGLIRTILSVAALVTLFLTHFIRRNLLSRRFATSGAGLFKPGGASNQPSLLVLYTTGVIVSLARCDSVGLFGLVLFMLGDSFTTLHVFIGVSALAMYFYRPKREELETLAVVLQTKEVSPSV